MGDLSTLVHGPTTNDHQWESEKNELETPESQSARIRELEEALEESQALVNEYLKTGDLSKLRLCRVVMKRDLTKNRKTGEV